MNLRDNDNADSRIERLLKGAIDPHVHSGPSIAPRALDHVELLRQASVAGFAAVLPKPSSAEAMLAAIRDCATPSSIP